MTAARQQGIGEQLDLFDEVLKATMRHGDLGPGRSEARAREERQADTAGQRERALTRGLMEKFASSANLNQACKRVKANQGVPGVDGMTVNDLRPWIAANKDALITALLDGSYQPQPVRGVEIPSPAAASANWAFRRWWIVWSNRRSCKSWSRCSTRVSRRRVSVSARDGGRMTRYAEPGNTLPAATPSSSIWISKSSSTGSTTT
jgi:hypothetical protein